MAVASNLMLPDAFEPEQRLVLRPIGWAEYEATLAGLGARRDLKLVYLDGRLTFVTKSRQREWYAEVLGLLVVAIAAACRIRWEPAGQATFRRRDLDAGVEGDKAFYLGEGAARLR